MIKPLKIMLKLALFLSLIILSSCEKEIYVDAIKKHPHLVKRLDYNQLQKYPKIINEIQSFKDKQDKISNRSIGDYTGLFFIDMNDIMYVLEDGRESYTFKIERDSINNLLENLVFTKDLNEEEFKVILAQYKENVYNADYLSENLIRQLYVNDILYKDITNEENLPLYLTKFTADCLTAGFITTPGETCQSGEHVFAEGASCSYWGTTGMATPDQSSFVVQSISCDNGGGEGIPSINNGGFSTGPHGGGGSIDVNNVPNPCVNLKKHLSATTGIKLLSPQIYPYLKNQLALPNEVGFYFEKSNNTYVPHTATSNSTNRVSIRVGTNDFCSIHTHRYPIDNPMFSWEDVYTLQQYFQLVIPSLEEEVAVFIAVKDGNGDDQLYALKVDDISIFSDMVANDIMSTVTTQDLANDTTDEAKLKTVLRIMNKKQHDYNTQNPNSNQEVPFLNYFANSGISLYKANASLTNWDKLTLSNNASSPITKTPCN